MADLEDIEDAFHGDIFDETSDVFNPKNIEEVDNDEEDLAEEEEEEEEEEEDEEEAEDEEAEEDEQDMAGQLAAYGYGITKDPAEADVWLLNSCTVKNPSESHFVNTITKGQDAGKKIVLAGCVPQAAPKHKELQDISIIGVQQIDRVVEVVEETIKGHTVRFMDEKKKEGEAGKEGARKRGKSKKKLGGAALSLPKIRKNKYVEILPISTGCLNQCTYCKTKHARGDLGSYPKEEIAERVKTVLGEGVREIWMSSEDTGAYGRDINTSLPDMLRGVVDTLLPGTMLRVGMTNPPYMLEHIEEVAEILNHPRVYSFLHIPVQAASDHVLEDMKRKYTLQDFEVLVDYLLEHVPGITIATDIICGFPTETASDFEETLRLIEKYKFPIVNISQFYPRPGTPAAKMKRVPTDEVKRRSRELTKLFMSYRTFDHRVGETHQVIATELAHDKKHIVAHNKSYEQVLVPLDDRLMGKTFSVKITKAEKYCIHGEVIEESLLSAPVLPDPITPSLSPKKRRVLTKKEKEKEKEERGIVEEESGEGSGEPEKQLSFIRCLSSDVKNDEDVKEKYSEIAPSSFMLVMAMMVAFFGIAYFFTLNNN
eukprot:CAMPEP_0201541802 /NCGR_PEP_ID=MMETSP0161_2-20130828/71670_1 /ASSEMBLY_ACC=CAM_ASM_000251 /TAXON_ID=180227 /ORGANISM="Neoparamoeba aestuarina, Strain SoJaBio B1-5/56/2" /LENGTH=596 /DNA_ID=CAMNT_0047949361 /DNA_START=345 /DNA_END=2135 /DNA_ORIENTATION=-